MGRTSDEHLRGMEMFASQVYVITVQGALEPTWSDRLGGMTITVHPTADGWVTILTGELVDQAALQGILKTVYDLGLPVISVASA
jgi:hypothetical protein